MKRSNSPIQTTTKATNSTPRLRPPPPNGFACSRRSVIHGVQLEPAGRRAAGARVPSAARINRDATPLPEETLCSDVPVEFCQVAQRFTETLLKGHTSREKRLANPETSWLWKRLRKPAHHVIFRSNEPHIDPSNLGTGALLTPPDIGTFKAPSFWDIPPRTSTLVLSLVLCSLCLSAGGVAMILFPVVTDDLHLGWVARPNFFDVHQAREILRAATVLGQWHLPAQIVLTIIGPAGTLCVSTLCLTLACRELALIDTTHRFGHTTNPIYYGFAVLAMVSAGHGLGLAGYWTIYRYAPPLLCRPLCFLCRLIPHALGIVLCSSAPVSHDEVLLPFAVLVSIVGMTLSVYFACCTGALRECLPSDNVFIQGQTPLLRRFRALFRRETYLHITTWLHLMIHSLVMAYPLFLVATLPDLATSVSKKSGQTINLYAAYSRLLACDALGRYFLPMICDLILGQRLGRLGFLVAYSVVSFPCTLVLLFACHLSTLFSYALWVSTAVALLSSYMLSLSRATFHQDDLTVLMNGAETLAIWWCLTVNHLMSTLSHDLKLKIMLGSLCLVMILVTCLWIRCRDYGTDAYGYPLHNLLSRTDVKDASQEHISTAMIPIWVTNTAFQERLQRNYYCWNSERIAPSKLKEANVLYTATQKKREDELREHQREIQERIAL